YEEVDLGDQLVRIDLCRIRNPNLHCPNTIEPNVTKPSFLVYGDTKSANGRSPGDHRNVVLAPNDLLCRNEIQLPRTKNKSAQRIDAKGDRLLVGLRILQIEHHGSVVHRNTISTVHI